MRYFLSCAYLGKNYVGWQKQQNGFSVQEAIENAFFTLLQHKIVVHGSSRTDAGVHARNQFAHFDIENTVLDLETLKFRLNSLLPFDIAINNVYQVNDDCHSRFDAISRQYIYRIHTSKNPFVNETSLYYRYPIDLKLMNQACKLLIQNTNFQCFSKVKTEVNNYKCTIEIAEWNCSVDGFEFKIKANRFLRGMVRAIVGTMLEIGSKKINLTDFSAIMEGRNRQNAGKNVAAHGLTLESVDYPITYFL